MEPTDLTKSPGYEAALRESKDRVAIEALALCSELHIRAMVGGGPVLSAHGLVAPGVARNAAIVVDPQSIRHLHQALLARGWKDVRVPRRGRILPSARVPLHRDGEEGGLILYSVIPGFFADPAETFDIIWERHKEIPVRGTTVRALGRLTSAILASYDGFDNRIPRHRSNFDFFIRQFKVVLNEREREITIDHIRRMGGCAEMSDFIIALGYEPCEFTLPSVAYVRWRLQVDDATDQLRRALAMLELGPHGRRMLYDSKSGRPRSRGDFAVSLRAFPSTVGAIFGARRRWARALRDNPTVIPGT